LIRPLSATPSPEPSLHFGTPSHRSKSGEIEDDISEGHETSELHNQVSSGGEEESEELVDDARVAEMRKIVIAWGLDSDELGSEQTTSSRERQLAMMVICPIY
jgi:hypothetical protein